MEQLNPLRERGFLTYFNGSGRITCLITVVATGDAPFHRIVTNVTYPYDAPLDKLTYGPGFDF